MTHGHREAQRLFLDLGSTLGFKTALSWSQEEPGDGVWLYSSPVLGGADFPFAAIEVVVSESRKSIRGSIDTLSAISPALGILLIHDSEIRRRIIRRGGTTADANAAIDRAVHTATDAALKTRQRTEVWTPSQLTVRLRLASGSSWAAA